MVFNIPSAETLIFSLKFDQFDPSFSQMTQKVCYIKQKNSEILSKLRNSESVGGSDHISNFLPEGGRDGLHSNSTR